MTVRPSSLETESRVPGCARANTSSSEDKMANGHQELSSMSEDSIWTCSNRTLTILSEQEGILDDPKLTTRADMRQRLVLINRLQRGAHRQWEDMFSSLKCDNEAKVSALQPILQQMQTVLKDVPMEPLSDILHLQQKKHLGDNNLLDELVLRQGMLNENAEVVVIGETNGGKSSLLNLILGQDLLPTAFTSCTNNICKIQYAQTFGVKVALPNGQWEEHHPSSQEETREVLRGLVSEQDVYKRERDSDFRHVTVELPAQILKCGVTLVDTPGIGEDDNKDEQVLKYLKSTSVSAFICVIKSNTGGGLQKDRLLSILESIREHYRQEDIVIPRATFVCHRWDSVDVQNRDKVKANSYRKLESVWPGFQHSHAFFFSTLDTQKHISVDHRFVTDSFYELLTGFRDLFKWATSHGVILNQYSWMKNTLAPSCHHLRAMITHCIGTTEDLERDFRAVAAKQERLLTDSESRVKTLQREVKEVLDRVTRAICDIFDLQPADVQGFTDYDELVEYVTRDNEGRMSKEERVTFDERLVESILQYVDTKIGENGLISSLETMILEKIQDHLGLFRAQVLQIKHDLMAGVQNPRNATNSLDSLSSSRSSYMSSLRSEVEEAEIINSTADPVQLARAVKALLRQPHMMNRHSEKRTSRFVMKQNIFGKMKDRLKYKTMEPAQYIENRCLKIAKKIREGQGILQEVVGAYTDWIEDCVNRASSSIPQFTAVNERLMGEIRQHRESLLVNKETLKLAMKKLEDCRRQMKGFGSLFLTDINPESLNLDVSVNMPTDLTVSVRTCADSGFVDSGSDKKKIRSFWARLQAAKVEMEGVSQLVTIKTYLCHLEEDRLLTEIAELRCLDNKTLAPFFGMTRLSVGQDGSELTGETVNSFLFLGNLVSAKIYANRAWTNQREWVPSMILALLEGLNYIHREKLVHMELNSDTITISAESGEVKLCHFGLPHSAALPSRATFATKSCVCLSPRVLKGEQYAPADDVYAFALVLWEMLHPQTPPLYADQRQWPLHKFIAEVDPAAMLKERVQTLDDQDPVRRVLAGALFPDQADTACLSVMAIQSMLHDLPRNRAVEELKSRRITPPIRRGSSAEMSPLVQPPIPVRPPRRTDLLNRSQTDPTSEHGTGQDDRHPEPRQSCPTISTALTVDDSKRLTTITSKDFKKNKTLTGDSRNSAREEKSKADAKEDAKVDQTLSKTRRRFSLTSLLPFRSTSKKDSKKAQDRRKSEVTPPLQQSSPTLKTRRRSGLVNCDLSSSFLSLSSEIALESNASSAESSFSKSPATQSYLDEVHESDGIITQQVRDVLENELSGSKRSSSFLSSLKSDSECSPPTYRRVPTRRQVVSSWEMTRTGSMSEVVHKKSSKDVTRTGSLNEIPPKKSSKRYRAPMPIDQENLGSSTRSADTTYSLPSIMQRQSLVLDNENHDNKRECTQQIDTRNVLHVSFSKTSTITLEDTSESQSNSLSSTRMEPTQRTFSCHSIPTSDLGESDTLFSKSKSDLKSSSKQYSSTPSISAISNNVDEHDSLTTRPRDITDSFIFDQDELVLETVSCSRLETRERINVDGPATLETLNNAAFDQHVILETPAHDHYTTRETSEYDALDQYTALQTTLETSDDDALDQFTTLETVDHDPLSMTQYTTLKTSDHDASDQHTTLRTSDHDASDQHTTLRTSDHDASDQHTTLRTSDHDASDQHTTLRTSDHDASDQHTTLRTSDHDASAQYMTLETSDHDAIDQYTTLETSDHGNLDQYLTLETSDHGDLDQYLTLETSDHGDLDQHKTGNEIDTDAMSRPPPLDMEKMSRLYLDDNNNEDDDDVDEFSKYF